MMAAMESVFQLLIVGIPVLMLVVWATLDWKQGRRGFQPSWALAAAYLALLGAPFVVPLSVWYLMLPLGGVIFGIFAGMLAAIVNHFRP